MSIHYYVKGVIESNETFEEMKKIWVLCEKNKIDVPDNVIEYFDGENPSGKTGMEYDIDEAVEKILGKGIDDDSYRVDLKKVPSHIRYIKFIISE